MNGLGSLLKYFKIYLPQN